jgi:hypothetical protein
VTTTLLEDHLDGVDALVGIAIFDHGRGSRRVIDPHGVPAPAA